MNLTFPLAPESPVQCLVFDNEADWLAERANSWGSSEVPGLFNVCASPRMDAAKIRERTIREKATGERRKATAAQDRRRAAGRVLEAQGLTLLQEQLGKPVVPQPWTIYRHADYPRLHATPDALVPAIGEGVEVKAIGPDGWAGWGSFDGYQGRWQWAEEPPLHVALQALTGMACTGLASWRCVVVFGTDHYVWRVERDEALIAAIRAEAERSWFAVIEARKESDTP